MSLSKKPEGKSVWQWLRWPVVVLVIGGIMIAATPGNSSLFEITKNLDIYTSIYRELNTYYVDDVDPNSLMREGVDAMLESLDPYTSYISEAEMENHRFQVTGKYGGIGAVIRKIEGDITVIEPYEGFAAFKAGLLAGDKILNIDGKDVTDKNTDQISEILRGSPGTEVRVAVDRPYTEGNVELTLVREEIKVDNVPYYGRVGANNDIGYIRLTQFTENAGQNVANALRDLKAERGLSGVILDLRGNPGGLLREAVNVSNVFIPKGELIVSTRGKVKEWDRSFKTLNPAVDTDIPVAVLINRSSASASEIVAGVIQDLDRGIIIGERSFGKGLVQSTRDIPYKTKLKVTTAKYYTPSGRCIQAIDYSSRNDDGSVGKIPDSLMAKFSTRNGRAVYDGGGVSPEVKVNPGEYGQITITLLRKNHIFNYATKYRAEHEEGVDARGFELTDADWVDFKDFLEGKDYRYTTSSERVLDELVEATEDERYFDSIESSLESLRSKLAGEKDTDVDKFRKEISEQLVTEIVGRYHYQKGSIESAFAFDPDLKEALRLLESPGEVELLLIPSQD